MARKIWQGDCAAFWFGPRGGVRPPSRKPGPEPPGAKTSAPPDERPLGLVEAHRKAQREKRVLKP